jgi:hypothetical protein
VTDRIGLHTGDVTATLAAAAMLLKTLPLEEYRGNIAEELRLAYELDAIEGGEPTSAVHRRARRGALLAAVGAARDFITAMEDAMQHNRATARAVQLEASAAEEHASVTLPDATPGNVHQIDERRGSGGELHQLYRGGSALHRTFPGARRTIPASREEALPDDLA